VVSPRQSLGAARGEIVVCVPVYGANALLERCLRSLAENTGPVRILVADDASVDGSVRELARRLADDAPHLDVAYCRQDVNAGFVRNTNDAFAAAAHADVVVVNSDVVVPPGWLERLRDAACSDALVATASTLTNHGWFLSVPERNVSDPDPPGALPPAAADVAVARFSPRLRPRIPTAVGHCLYVRRSALDLVGDFDEGFSPGYGEEADFSQRCLHRGLVHVVADDVFVYHRGEGSFGAGALARKRQHERIVRTRYPYYEGAVREASTSDRIPLARSIAAAKLGLARLSVTIDGAALGRIASDTQAHVLELIGALLRHGEVDLRVRVLRTLGDEARAALERLGAETFRVDDDQPGPRTDVVHVPSQVATPPDMALLRRMGRALVLTQEDLTAFHNPAYFDDFAAWHDYRRLAADALAAADHVAFISAHAASEALNEDLVEPQRARVVTRGVDHRVLPAAEPVPPSEAHDLRGRPFLLCMGPDHLHRNRPFALRVFEELCARHDFPGRLVFAGPHVRLGSSRDEEAGWRASRPDLAARVVDLGAVTDGAKAWLYRYAVLVLYPAVRDGFELVPFDAAEAGTPTLWAAHWILAEMLPREAAQIIPWDAAATADRVALLLRDAGARDHLVEVVREAAARFRWDVAADDIVSLYRSAATAPLRAGADLQQRLPDLALALVGPGGWIPPDVQRALFAISTRPRLRGPVFGALVAGYRALHRTRRLGSAFRS
jgi:GT2 family glycosyltransferase/glycosyltransferase involved in cell wall biosynthesis